jgi:hypothetical protein
MSKDFVAAGEYSPDSESATPQPKPRRVKAPRVGGGVQQAAAQPSNEVAAAATPAPPKDWKREWTDFTIGEVIEIKGSPLRVHDVSEQRLVLKFVNKN